MIATLIYDVSQFLPFRNNFIVLQLVLRRSRQNITTGTAAGFSRCTKLPRIPFIDLFPRDNRYQSNPSILSIQRSAKRQIEVLKLSLQLFRYPIHRPLPIADARVLVVFGPSLCILRENSTFNSLP